MLGRVGAAESALYDEENAEPSEPVSLFERVQALGKNAFSGGGVLLAFLFVAGAGVALLRDKVLAHTFGAGPELDAFFTALILPQLILEFLVVGGVVGPFLPLFVGLKGESEAIAREFARTILTLAIIVMAVAMGIVFIFAPQTASFMAPGYVGSQIDEYAGLLRIMCLGQIVFAASFVLGEVLVAERKFLTYGLADLMYNAGIVAGALVLSTWFGIYGAAIGVLVGACGHLAIRVVGIYHTSFRPRASLALRTKGIGEFLRLTGPKMISQPVGTLMLAYFASLASTLAPGSTTDFSFARNFQSVGESMVGLAFATAAFPALSAAVSAGDKRAFKKTFSTNLITIGFFSTCVGIGLLVLGGLAIDLLLSGGAFDATDRAQTTMILAILAVSVPFESLVELFARALFATHNTVEPMLAAWAGFVVGVSTTWILSSPLGLAAIPIGYTACRVAQLILLGVFLRPRMARIGGSSRWSRALVRDRWGGFEGKRQSTPMGQVLILAILLVFLTAGTAFTASQALSHSSLVGEPQTTPWARVGGTRAPIDIVEPTALPAESGQPQQSLKPSAATPVFSMDLYQKGDFISEIKDTWCVPAAMQTSMNIMSAVPDTSRDTQAKLYDLAVSLGGSSSAGADPIGWAEGLQSLGYGNYQVGQKSKMVDAIHVVAKQIRMTQRPAGIIVWDGWHSWVVSGFTATADPAMTDAYTVISIAYEDVWYPRVSTRNPRSRPPDSTVLVSQLQPVSPPDSLKNDYRPWHQSRAIQGRQGNYIYVIPVV
jgi:putative peptidoglycan lipid II flippase